jgi:hypothetical protein
MAVYKAREIETARANSAPMSRAESDVGWNGIVHDTRARPARDRRGIIWALKCSTLLM